VKTAQQAQQAWTGSSGRASTNFQAGVAAYNGDWAGATTAQQAAMVNNWTQAVNNGSWAQGVNATGTAGWKSATQAKEQNYLTGFNAGANAYGIASGKIMNYLQSAVPALPPRGDINQNLQRSNALALALHSQRGNLGAK
jgi:hypothetical protein